MKRPRRPPTSRKIKRAPGARTRMPTAPLSRLRHSMDLYEFQAADEILAAYKMQCGLLVARDPDLHIPERPSPGAADDHAARRTDLVRVYPAWRRDMRDSVPLRVVDAVLFEETPLGELDTVNRWPRGTARKHLAVALKHFTVLRGNAPNGVQWRYAPVRER